MQTLHIRKHAIRFCIATTIVAAGLILVSFIPKNNNRDAKVNNTADGKKVTVKIYPNPSPNGVVHIDCDAAAETQLYFYVFDLEGTMMHNVKMKGKDKKTITGLKKGLYMYDVFKNDESIERGKIIVK